jgi:dihydrofolate reductase
VGTVIMHDVTSVDGFIADDNDEVGPLHEWYFNGDTPFTDTHDQTFDHSGAGAVFKVSSASAPYVRSMRESIGVIVMGRRLFDLVNGWEGDPPAGEHVVVVSHRPKPEGWHPEASYHFVDDVTAAIAKAQDLAGGRADDQRDRRRCRESGSRRRTRGRGRDGRGAGRLRVRQTLFRQPRGSAPARRPARGHSGRAGAAPAVQGPSDRLMA